MKKTVTLSFLTFSLCFKIQAQFLQTYTGDNYSGINAALLQPAAIADSRFLFDINVTGAQNALSSNYGAFNANYLSDPTSISTFKYYRKSIGKSYYYQNQELHFGCFMITLTPKDAVGFVKRTRTISNLDGLDQDMALLLFSDMNNASLNNQLLTSKKLSYQKMKYKETAFSYARVLIDDREKFIKAGATLKVLNGVEALSLYSKDVELTPINSANTQFTNTEFSYGYSHNNSDGFNNKLSLGLDLGVVYEFRPDHKTFFYDMDGKKGLLRKDLNKYKFRIGASLLDIGRIKFTKTNNSHDFIVNQSVNGITSVDKNNLESINSFIINNNFQTPASNKSTFKMNLPTALSIQADYYFRNNIYFGYTSYIPIWLRSDEAKVHNLMRHVFLARYEKRNFGVAIPVSIVRNGQINAGLNVRYGAITVGTTNLSSYLMGERRLYDLNIYFAVRAFRLYPAPADKDGDKVSDKKDYCPTEPGLLALEGCPDADLDGLADYKDYCPNVAGPLDLNGCPDTDSDGVLDYLDACPTEKGFAINKGCPDRDKDGILDVADRCPDVPGIPKNNGCPEEPIVCCADSDGDGILDRFDDCPTVFGKLINKGCPSDSIGIDSQIRINNAKQNKPENKAESKTNIEGKVEKTTTPKKEPAKGETNSEKKIIHDTLVKPIVDRVPTDPIPVYKTVPIEPEHSKGKADKKGKGNKHGLDVTTVMDTLTATVYFDKDADKVTAKYYTDLNKIIKAMKANRTAKLIIQGHTDNDGDDEYNITLSHKRTMAVLAYMRKRGLTKNDEARVEILYFGERKPVIENTDEKKKQVNRRVELKIIP